MKQNYDTIIGIDPDCDRSGAAELDMAERRMEVCSLRFPELMEFLPLRKREADAEGRRLLVVVEASWMTEANWHGRPMDNRRVTSKKGYDVGRNHEAGRKIVEMAKDHYGLEVKCRHPLRKCWSGRDGRSRTGRWCRCWRAPGWPSGSRGRTRRRGTRCCWRWTRLGFR